MEAMPKKPTRLDEIENHLSVWFLDLDLELAQASLNGFCRPTETHHRNLTRDSMDEPLVPLGSYHWILAKVSSHLNPHEPCIPLRQILQTRVSL